MSRHRAWWHAFHRRSYVALPERTLQRFHRAQLYILAAVTGPGPERLADAPALLGPSRHLGIGPVAAALEQGPPPAHEHLAGALPGVGSKAGRTDDPVRASGALALWEAHRYTAGPRILRYLLRPALAGVVGYYSGFLMEGVDGRLYLPVTHSPGQADVSDCTHDLSLLRWAVTTLVTATRGLREKDSRLTHREGLAARLTPCHTDTFDMEGVDGRLYLPVTHSPGQADVSDCTHDLSLLRWAVTTLVTATRGLREKDSRLTHREGLAARLTPCHTDTFDVVIGAGLRVARSCAEPSHLVWLLLLRQVPHPDADPALAHRSLHHWADMRDAWRAGSYATATAAAVAYEPARRAPRPGTAAPPHHRER